MLNAWLMNAKSKQMIEVYSQNFNGVWFGFACAQKQIITSYFGATQQLTLSKILCNIPFSISFQVFHEPSPFAKNVLASLKCLYDGKTIDGSLPLSLNRFPTYTQRVLKATLQIPLGYVTTYGAIANALGGGPRAVGNIMASNPFAPIIPCHRVVKSDFGIGGYGMGGIKVKVELLSREKQGFSESKSVDLNGCLLPVFPVEFALRNFQ
jgi:methylated-DNA-[protein]-cysteine S-methyltransferase